MIWAKYRHWLLLLVYVAFFTHTAIWHYWGYESVGHLGFGELFGTLRSGVITAGTIFTLIVFVHALFFGGLFCGWLCHWGITQDLAAWIMKKCGIKPQMRHLDSRLIPWVWFLVIIAQVILYWIYTGLPTEISFNIAATPVWTGVPRSILLICMTTLVSGFILIFLFGERAFCRSICTFRLWFSWFEKIAPHKIRQTKACTSCHQECNQACPMGINIAEEIKTIGHIKNNDCIKCHICIGACPNTALITSMKKNSFHKEGPAVKTPGIFSNSISILQTAMAVIILVLLGFDLGGNVSLSLGFLSGFIIIHILVSRTLSVLEITTTLLVIAGLWFRHDMNDMTSLTKGIAAIVIFILIAKVANFGDGFDFISNKASSTKVPLPIMGLVLLAAGGLAFYETNNSRLLHMANAALKQNDNKAYASIMELCAGSHSDPARACYDLGRTQLVLKEPEKAINSFKKSLEYSFSIDTAENMLRTFDAAEFDKHWHLFLDFLIQAHPDIARFKLFKGKALKQDKNFAAAEKTFQELINAKPDFYETYIALGELRIEQGLIGEAADFFAKAYAVAPASSAYFMADLNRRQNKFKEAEKYYAEAVESDRNNAAYRFDQGTNFAVQRKFSDAIDSWQEAIKIDPDFELARESITQAKADLEAKKAAILGPTDKSR